MPNLSVDWPSVPLGDALLRIDAGNSPDLPDRPAQSGEWGVLKVSAIKPDGIRGNENKAVVRPGLIDSNLEVRPGDVIITRANTPDLIGLACFVSEVQPRLMLSDKTLRLVVDRRIADPRFIAQALAAPVVRRQIVRAGTGSSGSMKNISQREIRSLLIPFPALPVQSQIAKILDSIEALIHSTERAIAKQEILGQGLLQDELDRLGDPTLPWSTVGQEFDIKTGITLGPHRVPRRHPVSYLRVANVQRGSLDLGDVALLEALPREVATYSLRDGDLLVVEGHANPSEIGRCAIVRGNPNRLLFQNHLFRLRPVRLSPEYALLWLNAERTRSYWRRMAATSSGLFTINSRQLRALPVAVPDRSEQERIVRIARAHEVVICGERDQLAKLRILRLGLMEDLLTGRVRVDIEEDVAT